jgi:hypothetical protein
MITSLTRPPSALGTMPTWFRYLTAPDTAAGLMVSARWESGLLDSGEESPGWSGPGVSPFSDDRRYRNTGISVVAFPPSPMRTIPGPNVSECGGSQSSEA